MSDALLHAAGTLESPAWTAVAVTPNDSADISPAPCRALWVGVFGDVAVKMAGGGGSVVFKGVQGLLPIRVDCVLDTDTTATDIVALY
jgi:hypothetical protein